MGIDVDIARNVTVNPNHEFRVSTEAAAARTALVKGVNVAIVFERNQNRVDEFDGNPLIYSLKRLNGFRIDQRNEAEVWDRVGRLIPTCHPTGRFNYIAVIPSSKGVAKELAMRFSNHRNVPLLPPCVVQKCTNGDVLNAGLFRTARLAKYQRTIVDDIVSRLERSPGSAFTMKDINGHVRDLFPPFKLCQNNPVLSGRRVVIVDDLLSTGTSLESACTLLRAAGAIVEHAITLIGPIGRIRP